MVFFPATESEYFRRYVYLKVMTVMSDTWLGSGVKYFSVHVTWYCMHEMSCRFFHIYVPHVGTLVVHICEKNGNFLVKNWQYWYF